MFAFIAAVSQAGGIIVDKIILSRRRMEVRVFIPVLFLLLFFLTALLMPFWGNIGDKVFEPYYIVIFLLMIASALVWNVFYYRGVQAEKVQEFELIVMFQPLLTILLAAALIEKNTNIHLLIASIIASIALIIAHINKNHFAISKAGWGLILAVVFMSVEILFQKILLDVFNPVSLYFIRTGIIFVFFILYYRPQLLKIGNANVLFILLTSAAGVLQMISKFYGFEKFGVVYTSLILILAPVLVYIISNIWLHEKLRPRTVISAVVILLCIVYATLLS